MVRAEDIPGGYSYYEIGADYRTRSGTVEPGRYVPVDYERVGGLTNAVGRDWSLRRMYVPEEVYGRYM
jgi:hypothetical protein